MAKPVITEAPAVNIIGPNTVIEGTVKCGGDIRIEGTVKGTVESGGKIVVGETGIIEGDVICRNGDFSGSLKGQVKASELLTLKASARLEGDIVCGKLAIEPGARFSGKCSMDPGKEEPLPAVDKNDKK